MSGKWNIRRDCIHSCEGDGSEIHRWPSDIRAPFCRIFLKATNESEGEEGGSRSFGRASVSFCADKRANYDACRSTEVSRVTRSLDPEGDGGPDRTIGEEKREETREGLRRRRLGQRETAT